MRLNINSSEGIIKLKRNQKLLPNKIYLLGSESVTNSLYFRKASDIRQAHKLIIHRLSGILNVIDYIFTPKGWLLLVRFKSEVEISGYYRRMRGFDDNVIIDYDIGRIISEIIRTTISSLVIYINKGSNRKGALVYKVFKRFSIISISAAKMLIGKMKKREIILTNQHKQFVPSIKSWNKNVLPNIGMCFLCSKENGDKLNNKNINDHFIEIVDVIFQSYKGIKEKHKRRLTSKVLIISNEMLM